MKLSMNPLFYIAPKNSTAKTYQELTTVLDLNPRTTDRHISNWLQEGKLERLAQGQYRKT